MNIRRIILLLLFLIIGQVIFASETFELIQLIHEKNHFEDSFYKKETQKLLTQIKRSDLSLKEKIHSHLALSYLMLKIGNLNASKMHLAISEDLSKDLKSNIQIEICIIHLHALHKFEELEYIEALDLSEMAIQNSLNRGHSDTLIMLNAYRNKMNCLMKLDRYQEAINEGYQSLNYVLFNKSSFYPTIGLLYSLIGEANYKVNNLVLAKKYLYESYSYFDRNKDISIIAHNYLYLALCFKEYGENKLYFEYIKQAFYLFSKTKQSFEFYGELHHEFGEAYHNLNLIDSADLYYKSALAIAEKVKSEDQIIKTKLKLAELYLNIGNLKAVKSELEEIFKLTSDPQFKGIAHRFAARYYIEIEYYESCLTHLNSALEILGKNSRKHDKNVAECYFILSKYYYEKGQIQEALNQIQKALIASTIHFKDTQLNFNPKYTDGGSPLILSEYLRWKAELLNHIIVVSNDPDKKHLLSIQRETIIEAIEAGNYIKSSYVNLEDKFLISDNNRANYKILLENTLQLNKLSLDSKYIDSGFELTQKSKSGILTDLMIDAKIGENHLKMDSLLKEESLLDRRIRALELSLNNTIKTGTSLEIDSLENEISINTEKLYQIRTNIILESNQSIVLKNLLENNLTNNVRDRLQLNQVVIEYFLFEDLLYIIAIDKYSSNIYKQAISPYILNAVHEIVQYASKPLTKYSKIDHSDFMQDATYLYNILIKPLESFIQDKELIIIPDDLLYSLPFEILIKDLEFENTDLHYLIKSNPISYAYSSSLMLNKSETNTDTKNILTFAPFSKEIRSDVNLKQEDIKVLEHSIHEIEIIKDHFESKSLKGKRASLENFLLHLENYDIVHLATHAELNPNNPNYSKILFYPEDGKSSLNANDIYDLRLNTDMMVLSACNTGAGEIRKGEGLMSFARALTFAGCKSLVLTQWTVEDKSSESLMNFFYEYLSYGYSKSKALQLAKIKYLEQAEPLESHPFYWAGYIVIGDDSPLIRKHGLNKIKKEIAYVLTAFLIALIILIIISSKKKPAKA